MLRAGHEPMNTTGADRYFEQALTHDADNASALIGLGGYHAAIAADFLASDPAPHLRRARETLEKALSLQPDNSIAHYFMGVVEKVQGEPEAALASFAKSTGPVPPARRLYRRDQRGHSLGGPRLFFGLARIFTRLAPVRHLLMARLTAA